MINLKLRENIIKLWESDLKNANKEIINNYNLDTKKVLEIKKSEVLDIFIANKILFNDYMNNISDTEWKNVYLNYTINYAVSFIESMFDKKVDNNQIDFIYDKYNNIFNENYIYA